MKNGLISRISFYGVLTTISLVMIVPFLWMINTSFKDSTKIFSFQFIPSPFRWENYIDVLTSTPFHLFYFNSLYIAALVTVGTIFLGSLAGYAFARLKFRGSSIMFLCLLSTMMIPVEVITIPLFLFMRDLGLINTHVPLIAIPILGPAGVFGVFVMRQFFLVVPKELEEAAKLDGCSYIRIYWNIMLPLAKPAIATLTIFTFLTSWNEFYEPLIYINSKELMTLPVALALFTDEVGTRWELLMSASVMATVPLLIVFFFAQKQFIEGIAMTGSK
ncbi:carbohydrate ABC transporter permease [Bacillus sp. FJAT-50079]|uniref:carbohydrate ABC transporter permease n=1 Tax=Bacillus sp. FJAT-50079 TaxID=2833577 RepID=UPI001BC93C4E|nr:carbohydrate ABC transporter permease [Bacillus sp. FJAT-50079]MBS4207539.1 carbohydrate ABC transporter permease [Bacillus sp. FJAT-50079]